MQKAGIGGSQLADCGSLKATQSKAAWQHDASLSCWWLATCGSLENLPNQGPHLPALGSVDWHAFASRHDGACQVDRRQLHHVILRRFRERGVGMVWEIDMIRAGLKNGGGRGLTRGDDAVIFGPNAGGGGDDDNETMMAAQQADTSGYM